jgi:two-component system sensor histidine kinase TctE
MKRAFSLQGRLALAMAFIFVLGVAAAVIFYYVEVAAAGHDLRERSLRGQARDVLNGLQFNEAGKPTIELPTDWAQVYAQRDSGFSFTLFDPQGVAVALSPNLAAPLARLELPGSGDFSAMRFAGVGAGQRAVLAARAPRGHVLVVDRVQPDMEMLVESLLLEESFEQFIVFVPFLIGSLLLIWLVSGWSLRPLSFASKEAATIGPANLTARIRTDRLPAEVRPLVEAVNDGLERLGRAYLAERRLTADAAHELRTPLAVLSLRLQRARDGAVDWAGIENDLATLKRIIGQLMDLARKESAAHSLEMAETRINLARIAREAAAQLLPLAEQAGRTLELVAPKRLEILGHADDLRDMLINLLDNALEHGEGTITLSLRLDGNGTGAQAIIEVRDEGPGPPAALKEAAFDRFHKGSASTRGAGLGLAIVRQVARNHGGDAGFLPGAGGRVRVSLPLKDVTNGASPKRAAKLAPKDGIDQSLSR